MGCAPSKLRSENREIRKDLEDYRNEIEKLKAENDALRGGGRTNYGASNDDENELIDELGALKKQNEKLQEEILNLKKIQVSKNTISCV